MLDIRLGTSLRRAIDSAHKWSLYRKALTRLDTRRNAEQRGRKDVAKESGMSNLEEGHRVHDDGCEDQMRKRRMKAAESLVGLEVEDPPDPATLSRELESAYEPGGMH